MANEVPPPVNKEILEKVSSHFGLKATADSLALLEAEALDILAKHAPDYPHLNLDKIEVKAQYTSIYNPWRMENPTMEDWLLYDSGQRYNYSSVQITYILPQFPISFL